MKKYLYFTLMALCSVFFSCEKEEVGGTATQNVAGEWYVSFTAIDVNGESYTADVLVEKQYFSAEKGIIRTFNTAQNVPNKMQISDMATFGGGAKGSGTISNYLCFNVAIDINQETGEFSTAGGEFVRNYEENYGYDPKKGWEESERFANVKIVNGKITKDGATQNNGTVDDAIEFDIYFDNNYDVLVGQFEYMFGGAIIDHYHVSGIRYSGLVEND
ncbi:MAG: hypothetical protein J6V76_03685 [Bacteroidales bacterium]|nr:hypothetical protein [Bacteroidales bacterium]